MRRFGYKIPVENINVLFFLCLHSGHHCTLHPRSINILNEKFEWFVSLTPKGLLPFFYFAYVQPLLVIIACAMLIQSLKYSLKFRIVVLFYNSDAFPKTL